MPNPPNGNNRQQINNARDALVGIIPDPKGQVEQITTALVYKYLDKLDSDSVAIGGRRTYFVGTTAEFSWKNLLAPSLTGDQRCCCIAARWRAWPKAANSARCLAR